MSDKNLERAYKEGKTMKIAKSTRNRILKRDNHTCQNCGISIKDEPHLLLEVDHIIPESRGGQTVDWNLQTLCWKCNRLKGNSLPDLR